MLWCDTKKEGFDVFLVFLYANIRTNFKHMSLSLFFIAGDVIHHNRLTMSVVFVSTCDMFCQISLALSSVEHKNRYKELSFRIVVGNNLIPGI